MLRALADNELRGSIPATPGNLLKMQQLLLNNNKLTGTVPSWVGDLPKLKHVVLHANSFSFVEPGALHNRLQILTLHNNGLHQVMPSFGNFSSLEFLTVFGNRFGNHDIPGFAAFSSVSFAWVTASAWAEWSEELLEAIAGLSLLAGGVIYTLRGQWLTFFRFTPTGSFENLHFLCVKVLLFASFAVTIVMCPSTFPGGSSTSAGGLGCAPHWHI